MLSLIISVTNKLITFVAPAIPIIFSVIILFARIVRVATRTLLHDMTHFATFPTNHTMLISQRAFFPAQTRPFRITFHTDATELVSGTAPGADTAEQNALPGGIFGFSLNYQQISC